MAKRRKYISVTGILAAANAIDLFVPSLLPVVTPRLNEVTNAMQNQLPGNTPLMKAIAGFLLAGGVNAVTPPTKYHMPLGRYGIKP